jgi:prevent-host-death family protein
MRMLNIHEAKTQLSSVLAEVERTGQAVVICRNGVPVADIVPHQRRLRSKPHPTFSRIVLHYDPTEVLSPEDWTDSVEP